MHVSPALASTVMRPDMRICSTPFGGQERRLVWAFGRLWFSSLWGRHGLETADGGVYGSGTFNLEFEILRSFSIDEQIDAVFAGRPFALRAAGEIHAVLPIFGRVASSNDLCLGFYAANVDGDKVHFNGHFANSIE